MRFFKDDPRYRIPVKADPNIVINHIRESHPSFVRVGLAMVEAWRRGEEAVTELVRALVPDPREHEPLLVV